MAAKKPGCLSNSTLTCGWTDDYSTKPIVSCRAVASHVFGSSANAGTYYVCAEHLAAEQKRIPGFIVNVATVEHLTPEKAPAVSG